MLQEPFSLFSERCTKDALLNLRGVVGHVGKGDEAKTGYIDKTGKVIWQPSN
jgi:hypothetical protein